MGRLTTLCGKGGGGGIDQKNRMTNKKIIKSHIEVEEPPQENFRKNIAAVPLRKKRAKERGIFFGRICESKSPRENAWGEEKKALIAFHN